MVNGAVDQSTAPFAYITVCFTSCVRFADPSAIVIVATMRVTHAALLV
jgi:hypothetical protein